MKSVVSLILCLFAFLGYTSAFQAPMPLRVAHSSTALNVFGNKKSAAAKAAEAEAASKYWQGEWVCKDCGYIYNRVRVCR